MDQHFCPYCMSPVDEGEPCKACGLTSGNYLPSPHHLPPGTVLNGRYLVGRVLGEGGFGITYIGCDLRLELKVAIKEYYPVDRSTRNAAVTLDVTSFMGLSAQSFERGKQKFLDEARTMARMDKQQVIVSVRDFFQANNTAYIVMEYIEGTTFSDLVEQKGGRIPPQELFQILEPLFRALSIMHEAGLIHRDISPDNLMLENGKVRLLDFGCARETTRGTETLTIALKHGYAPIEQYQQKGQGPWTDIYALCATIYYCLTGKAPPQALDRIVEDGLLLPSKLGVPIAPHQEEALLKGLMIRPNRRYQTVEELRAALYAPAPEQIPISTPEPEPEIQTPSVTEEPPAPEPPPAEPETEEEVVQTDPSEGKQPRKTPSKGLWAAMAGAAAVLILALVVLLPRGGGTPDPVPTGTEPSPSVLVESDRFANAVYLPETADEAAFRIMMENDSVSAVVLSAGSSIAISDGALEITKPLLIEAGAELHLWQPATIRGEGFLQVEGSVFLEGLLRAAEGGGIAVGPAGELTGSTLVWLAQEDDLTVAEGGVANLSGVDYGGEDSGERFLVLDEEYLFANATHVNSFAEYRRAVQSIYTVAIVIDSDIDLLDSWACSVPVLISEGVTVTAPVENFDFAGENSHEWLQDASVLINYGTLTGGLNVGDWDENGKDDFCAILNYGTISGDLFLDCRGSLLNWGEITITVAQVLQTDLYNFGTVIHSSESEELNWLNFFCDTVYNNGEIVEMGNNNSYLTLTSGVSFGNFGTLRVRNGGILDNQARLENRSRLIVDAGGKLNNTGWLIANAGGGTLELDPDSALGHTGLIQWCSSSELVFPHQVDDGGGSVLTLYDREDTTVVTTEEELRSALADDGCGLVRVSGDINVNGGLTITKGVDLTSGSLSFFSGAASFDLTVSGQDAFLYGGALELNGYGRLTLTDGAIMANVQTTGCKDLSIQNGGKLVVWGGFELSSGASVDLVSAGHLINLSGMTLEQADVSIGEGSVFRSCEALEVHNSSVEVGNYGELLFNNADAALYNTPLTIDERGFFSANANDDSYVCKLWRMENHGWMEIGQTLQLGLSSTTNFGTIQFSNDLTVEGALDNKGTMLALLGASVQKGTQGSFIGNEPLERTEWTPRPW